MISLFITIIFGIWWALAGAKAVTFAIFGIVFVIQIIWGTLTSLLEYKNLQYSLTSHSVNFHTGVFSLNTLSVPYSKITNANFNQSFFQRFFSVGDVTIDQEDSESTIKAIDQPTARKIMNEISSKSNIQPITSQSKK